MASSRHFAYNSSIVTPTGATQFGNVCVATTGWTLNTGGLKWWNGPDEDTGYIICHVENNLKTAASFSEIISGKISFSYFPLFITVIVTALFTITTITIF